MSAVRISCVICTRNRAPLLQRAIESLTKQTLGRSDFEVLVVDNNSADLTPEIVRNARLEWSNLRYVHESEPGLSRCRNVGLARARGEFVAFLDDDATASPHWLSSILRAFDNVRPQPACIGGKILPIWETAQPDWLPNEFLSSLTIYDKGDKSRLLSNREIVFGANMSFKRDILLELGGFHDSFKLYSDDAYVSKLLQMHGHDLFYSPEVVVHHLIPSSRVTVRYLCRRKYLGGKGEFLFRVLFSRNKKLGLLYMAKNLIGRPAKILQLLLAGAIQSLFYRKRLAVKKCILMSRCAGMWVAAVQYAWKKLVRPTRHPFDPFAADVD